MTQWEYHRLVDAVLHEGELDELGEKGWELVIVLDRGVSRGGWDYYFKRPKSQKATDWESKRGMLGRQAYNMLGNPKAYLKHIRDQICAHNKVRPEKT